MTTTESDSVKAEKPKSVVLNTVHNLEAENFFVSVKVTEDKLKLFIDVKRKTLQKEASESEAQENSAEISYDWSPITLADLTDCLGQHLAIGMLNQDVLESIIEHLRKEPEVLRRRVHKGKAPIHGRDGKVLKLVKAFSKHGDIEVDEKGFANYAELHLFDNVSVGQIVARVYPPQAGKHGVDVFGNRIPYQEGKEADFSLDDTLELSDSTKSEQRFKILKAKKNGFLQELNHRYSIESELVLKSGVNYECGNIDFIGKVIVQGDVNKGFSVKAKDSIQIRGTVTYANLSSDGDITVDGLVLGGDRDKIVCGGNFTVKAIEKGRVEAAGDITIQKNAVDSELRCGSIVNAPNGKLLGGSVFTVCGGEFKVIGSDNDVTTNIYVCSDIEASLEYAKLMVSISNHDDAIKLLKMHLGPLALKPDRIALLKKAHKAKMEKLLAKLESIEKSKTHLLVKKDKMLEGAKSSTKVRINYLSRMYPGTQIYNGDVVYVAMNETKGPGTIEYDDEEKCFRPVEYQPVECEIAKKQEDG